MWDAEGNERIGKKYLQILQEFRNGASTVHCQVIQNDYPERCSKTCTLQSGLYSKRWGFFSLLNNKISYVSKEETEQSDTTFQECIYW